MRGRCPETGRKRDPDTRANRQPDTSTECDPIPAAYRDADFASFADACCARKWRIERRHVEPGRIEWFGRQRAELDPHSGAARAGTEPRSEPDDGTEPEPEPDAGTEPHSCGVLDEQNVARHPGC